jgi:putative Mn2+ efflux pump MntP
MGFAGIIAGLIYSVGGTFYDLLSIGLNKGTALAYIAIPVIPLYFAIFGFVTGLIGAFLYNLFAKWFSKIEMNFEK